MVYSIYPDGTPEKEWATIAIGTSEIKSKWEGVNQSGNGRPQKTGSKFWNLIKNSNAKNEIDINYYAMKLFGADAYNSHINDNKNENADWIYLYNPKRRELSVFVAGNLEALRNIEDYKLIDTYSLDEAEPNWEKVDELGRKISEFENKKQKTKA